MLHGVARKPAKRNGAEIDVETKPQRNERNAEKRKVHKSSEQRAVVEHRHSERNADTDSHRACYAQPKLFALCESKRHEHFREQKLRHKNGFIPKERVFPSRTVPPPL